MCAGASRRLVIQTLTFACVTVPSRMTLENMLSQMGIGTKQLTDRYSGEYGTPVQDQHIYYAYEPSPPSHTASSKHHYSNSSGLKSNASMSALTLLAFLFFLHILQQCIKEHMTEMSAAPVVVMSASREGSDALPETTPKIDKTGVTSFDTEVGKGHAKTEKYETNPFKRNVEHDENKMMKINVAEHKPSLDSKVYGYVYKNGEEKGAINGFVSAMNDE